MKQRLLGMLLLVLACTSVNATLVSRSGGLAYYDTATNVTWVADANLAQTSGYDADGLMIWTQSVGWIASLNAQNAGLGYLGTNDWRLPTTAQPDASCVSQINPGGGFPLQGYRWLCTGSEMGYLLGVEGITVSSPTPFANLQNFPYWSGTEYAPDTNNAWTFEFGTFFAGTGFQNFSDKGNNGYAWAVRTGDVAPVPVPGAVWLFGGALTLLGTLRRKAIT